MLFFKNIKIKWRLSHWLGLGGLIFLAGCLSHSAENNQNIYFNLHTLLNPQIARLDSLRPTVKKTVSDQTSETQKLQISNWHKELKMFLEADINKSIFKGYYRVEKSAAGQKYIAQKSDLKTRLLEIKYKDKSLKISQLRIKYQDINFLYTAKKTLQIWFDPQTDLVSHYAIEGFHRNLFGISSEYAIDAQIEP
jgi:hypothetical protein